MENLKIRQIKFTSEEMTAEAKAPRKKEYCLMDDVDILSIDMLKAIKKRIDYGIKKRQAVKSRGLNN
jgi:hypothetical protein